MEAAAAAGFSAFEWSRDWGGAPVFYDKPLADTVEKLVRLYGIPMASIHGYSQTPEGMTYTRELCLAANINRLEFLDRLGGRVLVLHLPLRDHEGVDAAVAEGTDILEGLWPTCRRTGARIAVENLFKPRQFGAEFFDRLWARFPPEYLGFCYDSGHALITGWADLLLRYPDRLLATHLADNDGQNDLHGVPGTGKADWATIVPAVQRSILCQPPGEGTLHRPLPVGLEVRRPREEPLAVFARRAYDAVAGLWASKSAPN